MFWSQQVVSLLQVPSELREFWDLQPPLELLPLPLAARLRVESWASLEPLALLEPKALLVLQALWAPPASLGL